METTANAKPRSVSALRKAWEALMSGPDANRPEAAREIERLLDEAEPHGIANGVRHLGRVDTGNGRCLIEVQLLNSLPGKDGNRIETVKVHPAVAAIEAASETIAQLDRAMGNADARGLWEQVAHIAEALIEVLRIRPRSRSDCAKARKAVGELRFGRLASADADIYERLKKAVSEHNEQMQFTGAHHRLAESAGA